MRAMQLDILITPPEGKHKYGDGPDAATLVLCTMFTLKDGSFPSENGSFFHRQRPDSRPAFMVPSCLVVGLQYLLYTQLHVLIFMVHRRFFFFFFFFLSGKPSFTPTIHFDVSFIMIHFRCKKPGQSLPGQLALTVENCRPRPSDTLLGGGGWT